MVLFTGVQLVYVWFSVAVLAWAIPSVHTPPGGGMNGSQSMQQESFQASTQQDSWFKRQIFYVPKQDDWPVVVDPSLQPWTGNKNWN